MTLTDQQRRDIAYYFEGSCNSTDAYENDAEIPLSSEQVVQVLLDEEIEMCGVCGWWHHQSELDHVDGEVMCDQCAEGIE